jgi:type II secretory pathway component PulF
MAHHYEARQSLYRQARSAMIYPIAVLIVASLVVALLTVWVLPMLMSTLRDQVGNSATLPLPTRMLMGLSDFVQAYGWWLVPVLMAGTIVGLFKVYKTTSGKRFMDELILRVPVFGKLLKAIDTTRFARTLSALTAAGLDFNASLELTASVLHLAPFRAAVLNARKAVKEGDFLSEALAASHRFDHDVIAVVESGEATGKLPETLERLADNYEEKVTYTVKNLGTLIQPMLTIILGGIVFFIVVAFMMAYVSILGKIAG